MRGLAIFDEVYILWNPMKPRDLNRRMLSRSSPMKVTELRKIGEREAVNKIRLCPSSGKFAHARELESLALCRSVI
jgi:hypothetical protein